MTIGKAAWLSDDGYYRWRLLRIINTNDKPDRVVFIMCNPSTADAHVDDNTIRKLVKLADAWDKDVLEVVNLFSVRATKPNMLYELPNPIGDQTDEIIHTAVGPKNRKLPLVVCAWGEHGKYLGRGEEVYRWLRDSGIETYCLEQNASGHPKHPLYCRDDSMPKVFAPPWY